MKKNRIIFKKLFIHESMSYYLAENSPKDKKANKDYNHEAKKEISIKYKLNYQNKSYIKVDTGVFLILKLKFE
jgi:hypothetical protein